MGQYQTRSVSRSIDEEQVERDTSGETPQSTRIPISSKPELVPPLAPVFGSPIESKEVNTEVYQCY